VKGHDAPFMRPVTLGRDAKGRTRLRGLPACVRASCARCQATRGASSSIVGPTHRGIVLAGLLGDSGLVCGAQGQQVLLPAMLGLLRGDSGLREAARTRIPQNCTKNGCRQTC
jgi:hypothetical protein